MTLTSFIRRSVAVPLFASGLAVGFAGGLSIGSAAAEPFTIFIYESDQELALRNDATPKGAAYWSSYGAFAAEAQKAGVLRGGSALYGAGEIRTVHVRDGKPVTTQATYAASPMKLGGYFQIDVADMDAAIAWAAKVPSASTGAVEVRKGYPTPGM